MPGSDPVPAPSLPLLTAHLRGEGLPCSAALTPAIVTVPGALHPHQRHTERLLLTNTCSAPISYTWQGQHQGASSDSAAAPGAAVTVEPAQGVIPEGGSCEVAVSVSAAGPGLIQQRLLFQVEHVGTLAADLQALVQHPGVELAAAGGRLDFGVVRGRGGAQQLQLTVRNTSQSADTSFQLEQLPVLGGAVVPSCSSCSSSSRGPRQKEQAASAAAQDQERTTLVFEPASGNIPPGGEVQVLATCRGGSTEGLEQMVVACTSAAGSRRLLQATAVVALPHVAISRQAVDAGYVFLGVQEQQRVVLRNTGVLPCHFSWAALPAAESGSDGQQQEAAERGQAEVSIEPASGTLQPGESVGALPSLRPSSRPTHYRTGGGLEAC